MTRRATITAASGLLGVFAACTAGESPQVGESSRALGGVEGTLEYAIDAPWRIEPNVVTDADGSRRLEYGAIPIQISIHDTDIVGHDLGDHSGMLRPAAFCGLTVLERVGAGRTSRTFRLHELEEIERSYRWHGPDDSGRQATPPPGMTTGLAIDYHVTCKPEGLPGTCDHMSLIAGSSEWHATAWYAPNNTATGSDVVLEAVALIRDENGSCAGPSILMSNFVSVHLAEAPLPRFGDNRWLYGDLHYHSQGTDNEGETGYNYRGVIRAMGALGLDFAFATEHASNSDQVLDLDIDLFDIDTLLGLRDMSDARFRFLLDQLNRPDGVNARTAVTGASARPPQTWLSHRAMPQLFLGGELDAIPEADFPASEWESLLPTISYGNGLSYDVQSLWRCDTLSDDVTCLGTDTITMNRGTERTDTGTLIRDYQGNGDLYFGRNHLVYLPDSGADAEAFVPSNTSRFGGATRRLAVDHSGQTALLPEIERHGSAFLAHHWNDSNPGPHGPDGPPWSEMMLEKAWRSPSILGLQFWNEPEHVKTPISECSDDSLARRQGCEQGYSFNGSIVDDKSQASDGDPREGFRNGVFRLRPRAGSLLTSFYMPSPVWEEVVTDTDEKLHHGASSWDRMLLMGLDTSKTASLPWLPTGEPRRFFVAGGSDAHGDLNYRRSGYMFGTTSVSDAAIAKARNLVFVGNPTLPAGSNTPVTTGAVRHSQQQVTTALKAGHFSVTSGPALRIALDRDGRGAIDDGDPMMGDLHWMQGEATLPLLVQWESTAEFGAIEAIDLYVGVASADGSSSRTYAPPLHGPRAPGLPGDETARVDASGRVLMEDNYWRAPALRLTPDAMSGTMLVNLALAHFPVDDIGTVPQRLYVRAFAKTVQKATVSCGDAYPRPAFPPPFPSPPVPAALDYAWRTGQCARDYALTNPIWAVQDVNWRPAYQDAWTGFGDSDISKWNAGDVNRDGAMDLVQLTWSAPGALRVHTMLSNRDGTWTRRFQDAWPGFGDSDVRKWRMADVNGDRRIDLVQVAWSASTGIRVHTLLSNGDGTWNRTFQDAWPGFGLSDVDGWRVADVDGNGRVDLVHVAWNASTGIRVHTLASNGDGTWTRRFQDAWPGFGDSNVTRWRVADINGDGRADLVHLMRSAEGTIRVHSLRSTATGTWSMAFEDAWPGFGLADLDSWRVADVDGDRRTDLVHVMWSAPGSIRVHTLLSKGDGTWQRVFQDAWPGFGASDVSNWRLVDVDGDGRADLVHVMWSAPGNLRVHTLIAQGAGLWRRTYRDAWSGFGLSNVEQWKAADIDGNGGADLVHLHWTAPGNLRVHSLLSQTW